MQSKKIKALVLGGGGFIGTNLIQRLLREGYDVRATVHDKPLKLEDPRVDYVRVDLTQRGDCERIMNNMDYVFACAANTSGAAVMATNPLAHVTPNVVMNALTMEAAYLAGVKKLLFLSSSAAYPPTGDRPVREEEMFQGDPYSTYYAVGWMKRYAEILCEMYATKIAKPMATVVVRPSNVFGPYDKYDFGTSHVTAALIRRVVERQTPFEVWGNGEDIRDLIYIDDFLDGLMLAMEKTDRYGVYNIASGKGCSIKQILEVLLQLDHFDTADLRFNLSKPSMIPVRLVDTNYAKKTLGFECKISLEEGLLRTLKWYRGNVHPYTSIVSNGDFYKKSVLTTSQLGRG